MTQERVPETRDVKPNRAQRRHPERVEDQPAQREAESIAVPSDQELSVRAKSSGHKKKTADKWNQ